MYLARFVWHHDMNIWRPICCNEIKLEVLAFDELWGGKPDCKLILATKCRPVLFAGAVHRAATTFS